jgi:hypothetical protein
MPASDPCLRWPADPLCPSLSPTHLLTLSLLTHLLTLILTLPHSGAAKGRVASPTQLASSVPRPSTPLVPDALAASTTTAGSSDIHAASAHLHAQQHHHGGGGIRIPSHHLAATSGGEFIGTLTSDISPGGSTDGGAQSRDVTAEGLLVTAALGALNASNTSVGHSGVTARSLGVMKQQGHTSSQGHTLQHGSHPLPGGLASALAGKPRFPGSRVPACLRVWHGLQRRHAVYPG